MAENELVLWDDEYQAYLIEDLENLDSKMQKDVMRKWFKEGYEDPAMHTPHEYSDGGYIYKYGGPYDAKEELTAFFEGYVPESVIDELVSELEIDCTLWAGTIHNWIGEYYSAAILSNTEFHNTFQEDVEKIKSLLSITVDQNLQRSFFMLLYANVITSLETFLSDAFINTVLRNPNLIRRVVESNSKFISQKFKLSELFRKFDNINNDVKEYLLYQTWHNLYNAKHLYESTLNIIFPEDMDVLYKAIKIRHDIVHRNGKATDGTERIITKDDVYALMDKVSSFVSDIDSQFEIDDT